MAPARSEVHRRQQDYVDTVTRHGFDFGLTVADAFVRSIRSLGYKDCGTALDELIDNSIEATAQNVHVAFGPVETRTKPSSIAVIDDGVGMVPDMIRAAVVWGGTDREASQNGFGRFGYGLPSASVSQGRRFTVYSRTGRERFQAVALDVDEISDGKYVRGGRVVVPKPRASDVPDWLAEYFESHYPGGPEGVRTVVLWEKLDRLSWRTSSALERNLLKHIGLTYRNFLNETRLFVNKTPVEPIDPLFVTDGMRFFDLDGERAELVESIEINVEAEEGDDGESARPAGTLDLRMSYMSPTFFRKDKAKKAIGKNANDRFNIRRDHNGVVVCRLGRQIDVTSRCPLTTFVNNDRSIGIELNFSPSLDGDFAVTTAKQQVTISDRIWAALRDNNFLRILETLRRRYKEEAADVDNELGVSDYASPLKEVPSPPNSEGKAESDTSGEPHSDQGTRSRATRISERVIGLAKASAPDGRPFGVEFEHQPDTPFYRVEREEGQASVLYLNTAHGFVRDLYASTDGGSEARLRLALDALLFVLGACELDTEGSGRFWYASERGRWTNELAATLDDLGDHIGRVTNESERGEAAS